jgi:hypothetical protein
MSRKRPREDDIEEENRPMTRQRTDEIIDQITHLGTELSRMAEAGTVSSTGAQRNLEMVESRISIALNNAFQLAQQQAVEREAHRQIAETGMMEQEQQQQHENMRRQFLSDLEPITQLMSTQMTHGEQARIYGIILTALNKRLSEGELASQAIQEPNHVARISEVITIAYNYASEQLAATLTNMYNVAPNVTRQTVALITSSVMLYNYQPESVRSLYVTIPYFGQLFELMNRSNDFLRIVSNSAGTATTIYYLLINAGVDVNRAITNVRDMAKGVASICTASACNVSSSALTTISNSANGVAGLVADRLGKLITDDYDNLRIRIEGDSQGTEFSDISDISEISSRTGSTAHSLASVKAIDELLDTPIEEGGASINQNMDVVPEELIEQRFNIIVEGRLDDPVIARPIEMADQAIPVADVISRQSTQMSDSQMSVLSEDEDELHWSSWLFGSTSRGGKRIRRKSRRNMKLRKTRKAKRVRKGKMTKKGKKHNKTLKKYRTKLRR